MPSLLLHLPGLDGAELPSALLPLFLDWEFVMTHGLTAIFLLAAFAMYGLGFSGASGLMVMAGGLFESWFWIRLRTQARSRPSIQTT